MDDDSSTDKSMAIWDDIGDVLGRLRGDPPPLKPTFTPAAPTPDPMTAAVQQAQQQYPFLKRLGAPIAVTSGEGPYESESYMPHADDNPMPGHFTVELRSQRAKANPQQLPDLIASEGMDYLARSDPTYQKTAQQFQKSMSKAQLQSARAAYQREKKENGEKRPFEDWLNDVQSQEYIRGYLFPKYNPGWTGPQGEGQYTPEQVQMLDQLKAYLTK